MAFKGLFDMGQAATGAVDWLSMSHGGKPAASIDPETLFDFQETRPQLRFGANGAREIHWPANNIVWAQTPEGCHDLILLSGVEPNLRWRTFCETLIDLMGVTGTEMVVTLGSGLAMVPHTRAFPVTASTGDEELAETLGVGRPTYEGPTGLIGSLHQELSERHIPLVSLRVSVPHYVPGSPSPKATAALLAQIEELCGIPTEHAGLADEIRDWEARVHRALEDDEDVRGYVEDLEQRADEGPEVVYDVDTMTDEIENFLRNRSDDI
jgi:proteasome assembly chaperone (PAC2) family protein